MSFCYFSDQRIIDAWPPALLGTLQQSQVLQTGQGTAGGEGISVVGTRFLVLRNVDS